MNCAPTAISPFAVARPHADVASWPMHLLAGHMSANQVGTTGDTESKRLTPGLLLGALT
jgi:hypothetical protein